MLRWLYGFRPGHICFCPFHGVTCKYEEVVVHMSWCEVFTGQVCDPVTEIILTRHGEATPLAVKGMADGEIGVVAITLFGEVWGL